MDQTPTQSPALPDNPIQRRLAELRAQEAAAERAPQAAADPWAGPRSEDAEGVDPQAGLLGSEQSFWQALPEAALFVVRPRALVILGLIPLAAGVLVYGSGYLLYRMLGLQTFLPVLALILLILAFTLSFIARIIGAGTARERVMPAPPGTGGFVNEIVIIGGGAFLIYLLAMAPFLVYLLAVSQLFHPMLPWWMSLAAALTGSQELALAAEVLWYVGAAYFPLALLAFIRRKRLSAVLPPTVIRIVTTVPLECLAVAGLHLGLLWLLGELSAGAEGLFAVWLTMTALLAELALVSYALGLIAACHPQKLAFLRPDDER